MSSMLDTSHDPAPDACGGAALSRIQNAVNSAEDDLRQMNELNARSQKLEKQLRRNDPRRAIKLPAASAQPLHRPPQTVLKRDQWFVPQCRSRPAKCRPWSAARLRSRGGRILRFDLNAKDCI